MAVNHDVCPIPAGINPDGTEQDPSKAQWIGRVHRVIADVGEHVQRLRPQRIYSSHAERVYLCEPALVEGIMAVHRVVEANSCITVKSRETLADRSGGLGVERDTEGQCHLTGDR